MAKLSEFFGRKSVGALAERFSPPVGKTANEAERIDEDRFAEVGTQIGQENEALRSLLVDAGRKIDELEYLKEAFGKVVDPINKTLRSLEQEKSQNLSLKGLLAESRTAHDKLHGDFQEIEKKTVSLESENERLRVELELSQQTARQLDASRTELAADIATKRAQMGDLERQMSQETSQRQSLAEDNRLLNERATAAEKRIVQLETETSASREQLILLKDENRSLQASLEQTVSEASRVSRRLTETENALTTARSRIAQLEANVNESETELTRLTAALDEANERHRAEASMLSMRLDSLQSRATMAEKLLAEARENLSARTAEVRDFSRQANEANAARATSDKTVRDLQTANEMQDRQIRDLEQSRAALIERSSALAKTLKSREGLLARSDEKIQALTDRIAHLEADLQASQTNVEKRVEELNAELQRERMERAVAEGALEASRRDYARLHREVAAVQAELQRGTNPQTKPSAKAVEPIIKS